MSFLFTMGFEEGSSPTKAVQDHSKKMISCNHGMGACLIRSGHGVGTAPIQGIHGEGAATTQQSA